MMGGSRALAVVRFRRLTLRSTTGPAQRAWPYQSQWGGRLTFERRVFFSHLTHDEVAGGGHGGLTHAGTEFVFKMGEDVVEIVGGIRATSFRTGRRG